jgi:DNA-binding beta-propeller fold protein YncE
MGVRVHRLVVIASLLLATVAALVPASGAQGAPAEDELWVSRYNGTGTGLDEANAVVANPSGTRVFVTGRSTGSGTGYDYATVAIDAATGAGLWTQRYNGTGNGTDEANAIAVSPNGTRVFVTGSSPGTTSANDYATAAYDATTGSPLWVKRYNGLGNVDDYGKSVQVSPDGTKVFVTGYSYGGAIGYDYATTAYDASTGAPLWVRRYDGTNHDDDYGWALVVSPDGSRVYVTGYADMGGSGDDYVTQAYAAATGNPLWGKAYNGTGNSTDQAYSLAVSPDGTKVFVTGKSYGVSSNYDYATIAINAANGNSAWLKRYNGPANSTDYGQAIAVSPNSSRVFVTGYSSGSGSGYDYTTIGYNASTGAIQWGQRYNGPGNSNDYGLALAVTPDGLYVYATGYASSGASGNDYATAAYLASNGSPVGTRRYNGPGNGSDYGNAIDTSTTLVFVTGQSWGSGTDYDYGTVAYEI